MRIASYRPKYIDSGDLVACCIVVLFVMALALAPHLLVSRQVGQVAFFQMGFDEDTYIVYMVSNFFEIGRALSHYIFTAMFALTGHSIDWTMILADAIFPAVSAAAAYYLASAILSSWQGRILLTLLLLFGQDLLSLANVSVWHYTWLEDFRKLFGAGIAPDATTSYLTILRTPEPQISYGVLFAFLGLLLRIAKGDGRTPRLVVTACLGLLLPFTYTYIAFPVLLMAVWVALISFFFVGRDIAIRLTAIVLMICVLFIALSLKAKAAQEIYTTHLPSVTPALLVCGLIVVPLTIWTAMRLRGERAAWLAIGFLAIPIIVSNQQIITGLTVGTRDFERNVNYQFLALGGALISTLLPKRTLWMNRGFRWAGPGIAVVIALVVSNADRMAMKFWAPMNAPSMFATMQAIDAARSKRPDVKRLLVQPAELVPILNVRTGSRYDFVLNLAQLYMAGGPCCPPRIPPGGVPAISAAEPILFEYWWRSGTSPEDAQSIVTKEALRQGGYYLGYLYNSADAYAAASDGKRTRTDEIVRDIPRVIDRYRSFLQADHDESEGSPVLVLTEQEPSTFAAQKLKSELVGMGRVGSKTVYAYLQKPAQ